MIVRVRTNLCTKRVEISSDIPTFADLREAIAREFSIDPSTVFLSFDLQNEQPLELSDASPLTEGSVSHGTMLYLSGRMEKKERSFIDGDGDISHKGIQFTSKEPARALRSNDHGSEAKEVLHREETLAGNKNQEKKIEESEREIREIPAGEVSAESTSTSGSGSGATWRDAEAYSTHSSGSHSGDESPGVRAPDEQRRERLVDDSAGTPPRDMRFASTGMYSDMSPAMAVAMALSRLEGESVGARTEASGVVDDFGNPAGTAYAATGGNTRAGLDLNTSDAGDDLAAARALAMSRAAAIRAATSSSSHQMQGGDACQVAAAAAAADAGSPVTASDATVDEEVAASLREAGVSEHDIMLALRQAQDEQVAMKAQREEWRVGGGSVNLTNNTRHRPRDRGAGAHSHRSPHRRIQRPADVEIDGMFDHRETSVGQLSPLSSLLSEVTSADYSGGDRLSAPTQDSPGLEVSRRTFRDRLHEASSAPGIDALEREELALRRLVESHLVDGSRSGRSPAALPSSVSHAPPRARRSRRSSEGSSAEGVLDSPGSVIPSAQSSGDIGRFGKGFRRRALERSSRDQGCSGNSAMPRATSPLTYRPSAILNSAVTTPSSFTRSLSRASRLDDSTAVSQARARLLNLVVNDGEEDKPVLDTRIFGNTSSTREPVVSSTSPNRSRRVHDGALDELGSLLETLGHRDESTATTTATSATTASTSRRHHDPDALVLSDVHEEEEALRLALALSVQDK